MTLVNDIGKTHVRFANVCIIVEKECSLTAWQPIFRLFESVARQRNG